MRRLPPLHLALRLVVAAICGGCAGAGGAPGRAVRPDWAVTVLHTAGLILIYWVTPYDLRWHLNTSIDRVTIALAVLGCASAACWAVVALTRPPAPAELSAPRHPAGPPIPLPATEPLAGPA